MALPWTRRAEEPARRREPVHDAEHHVRSSRRSAARSTRRRPRRCASRSAPAGDARGLCGRRACIGHVQPARSARTTFRRRRAVAGWSVVPGAVGTVAFGRFTLARLRDAPQVHPARRRRAPARRSVQGDERDRTSTLFLPSRARSRRRAGRSRSFGHGFADNKNGAPFAVAVVYARAAGIATVAINVVGHGGGAARARSPSPARGGAAGDAARRRPRHRPERRRHDRLDAKASSAAPPRDIIGSRDGLRQTVVDLMQLVREIEVGMDVDGDGAADLDRDAHLLLRPVVRRHLRRPCSWPSSRTSRPGVAQRAAAADHRDRAPGPASGRWSAWPCAACRRCSTPLHAAGVRELRREHAAARPAAGREHRARARWRSRRSLERTEWVQQAGNPVAYAPHIRRQPLARRARSP